MYLFVCMIRQYVNVSRYDGTTVSIRIVSLMNRYVSIHRCIAAALLSGMYHLLKDALARREDYEGTVRRF